MELGISGVLTYQFGIYETSGEIISAGITFFSFFVCLVFIPLSMLYILILDEEKLSKSEFIARWGSLYTDVRYK